MALVLFGYYLRKYKKVFTKEEKDLFSSSFFVMVILSLISRILIRGFSLISIKIFESSKSLVDYLNDKDSSDDALVCIYDLGHLIPGFLFQIALIFNSLSLIEILPSLIST